MKHLGPILAGGLSLIIVLIVGIFSFLPTTATQPAAANSAPPAVSEQIVISAVSNPEIETAMAEREAVYLSQIETLNQTFQERQTVYQAQIEQLSAQITVTQSQLTELQAQQQDLPAQISQLETARAERQGVYQTQIQELQNQYADRLGQLQTQVNQAQAQLAEVVGQ
jgi:septal ring factor EnvC (AmiA/AmiB activator)